MIIQVAQVKHRQMVLRELILELNITTLGAN